MDLFSLGEAYVQKHARPGEDWEQARDRLGAEVAHRYSLLPACEVCAEGAGNAQIAAEKHRLGLCVLWLAAWPKAALSQRLFDAAVEQTALHARAQAVLVRGKIQSMLGRLSAEPHPINAIRAACAAAGYIQACEDLGLFEHEELAGWLQETHVAHEQAAADFVRQFHQRDPDALPWRSSMHQKVDE